MNPDPYVECDPEIDIDKNQEEEDANYFDDDDLGEGMGLALMILLSPENMKQRLDKKKAWRRKINFFTGKRWVGFMIGFFLYLSFQAPWESEEAFPNYY